MKQTCILIIGMHRSGTSAFSGTLSLLDVYLGINKMPGDKHNKKGYFENNNLVPLNEILLNKIGSKWDDIFFNETKLETFQKQNFCELKEQIQKEFKDSNLFAIKDPRITLLFPVYKKVLEELNINIKVIIPFRNPTEVANSLAKRDNFSFEHSMLLWSYHVLLAEKNSRGYKRVFVGFNELISDTKKTIALISKELDIDFNSKYTKKIKIIKNFLEPALKHHNLSINNNQPNKIPNIVQNIFNIRDIYNQQIAFDKFDILREELFDYQKLFFNQSIVKTFLNFKQIQQTINEQKELFTQNQLVLENRNNDLAQSVQTIELLQLKLSQLQKGLREKDISLVQTKQCLQTKTQALEQSQQQLSDIEQSLQKKNQEFNNAELQHNITVKSLLEKTQTLKQSQQQLCDTEQILQKKNQEFNNSELQHNTTVKSLVEKTQALIQSQQQLCDTEQCLQKKNQEFNNAELQHNAIVKSLVEKTQALKQCQQQLCDTEQILKKKTQKNEKSLHKNKQNSKGFKKINNKIEQLKQKLREQEQVLINKNQEIEQYKDELVMFYTSNSWKITRIMRKFRRLLNDNTT